MPPPKKKRTPSREPGEKTSLCAVSDVGFPTPGDRRLDGLLNERQLPTGDIYRSLYKWRTNWYLGAILTIRQLFYDYGFQLKAVEAKDKPKLQKWLDDQKNLKRLHKYRSDLWGEVLLNDAAISFWMEGQVKPTLLNLSEIDYSDEYGQERLTIYHKLSEARIREMKLSASVTARLIRDKKIVILPDDEVFHFEVIKREKSGGGLGLPLLHGMFMNLIASDSLEAHDAVLANCMRRVYEQHRIGHETKYGVNAGGKANMWKKETATAIANKTKGKTGLLQMTTNFDHEILYPGVDKDRFAASRYEGIEKRFSYWAMPIVQLLGAQSPQPQLLGLFRTMAIEERKKIALHLQLVGEVFGWDFPVKPTWGNECFRDERIFADLLKTGFAGGPVSQTTLLEELHLDPERERERKAEEAKLPKDQTTPIYDAAHGPAEPGALNGRPAGSGDRYARNGETTLAD